MRHSSGRSIWSIIALGLFLYGILFEGVLFGYSAVLVAIFIWIMGGVLFPSRRRSRRRRPRQEAIVDIYTGGNYVEPAGKKRPLDLDRYCENCGSKVDDPDAKFCMQCGATLN